MRHEALTVSEDQTLLLDGLVEAGEFDSRSGAIRSILSEYFRRDIDRTAALVATSDDVDFEQTVRVLDVDTEEFAHRVRDLNVDAVPDRLNAHLDRSETELEASSVLEQIEAEVSESMEHDDEQSGDS